MTFRMCLPDLPVVDTWISSESNLVNDSTAIETGAFGLQTEYIYASLIGLNGCLYTDSIKIVRPPHYDYDVFPKDSFLCVDEYMYLDGTVGDAAHSYRWTPATFLDDATSGRPKFSPTTTGDMRYKVVWEDAWTCQDSGYAEINVLPRPELNATPELDTVGYGEAVHIASENCEYYLWSPADFLDDPGSATPIARPEHDMEYIVTGTNIFGCLGRDTVRIIVDFNEHLFVPNAFTPNADGKNDRFRVHNLTFQNVISFEVFDRWGNEVYGGSNSRQGWDGLINGEQAPTGAYYYRIEIGAPEQENRVYSGSVTLLR